MKSVEAVGKCDSGLGSGAAWAALVCAGLLAVASCSDSGTAPDSFGERATTEAAAALAADAVLEDLTLMDATVPLASALASARPQVANGPVDGRPGLFERDRTVTFFDGDGNEQDAYDALTTASVHTVVDVAGEIERDNFSGSVERHRDMWVTGMEGEEVTRTWNGDGREAEERVRVSDQFGERSYHAEATSLIEDVVRSVDRAAHPWPLSGTITRHVVVTVTGGPNGDASRDRTVVVTFNGTRFATLSVDGEASHEVDLGARERRNPLRRRPR
jgi:hypothetical protein